MAPWAERLYLSTEELEGFQQVRGVEGVREMVYNRPFHYVLYISEDFDPSMLAVTNPKIPQKESLFE